MLHCIDLIPPLTLLFLLPPFTLFLFHLLFSARCNIYSSRLCYDVSVRLSVRLSVTEVHWRIIANSGSRWIPFGIPGE